jgi:hypothetical protein
MVVQGSALVVWLRRNVVLHSKQDIKTECSSQHKNTNLRMFMLFKSLGLVNQGLYAASRHDMYLTIRG